MAHRRTRTRRSGLKSNVWSVVVLDNVLIPSAGVEAAIVIPDEWQPAAGGFEHATMLRIRGWLSIARITTVVTLHTIALVIYKIDQNDTLKSALSATTYNEEDVLWTGGLNYPTIASGLGDDGLNPVQFDIDVKAMRRITSGDDVRLSMISSVNNASRISGVLRALIRKS